MLCFVDSSHSPGGWHIIHQRFQDSGQLLLLLIVADVKRHSSSSTEERQNPHRLPNLIASRRETEKASSDAHSTFSSEDWRLETPHLSVSSVITARLKVYSIMAFHEVGPAACYPVLHYVCFSSGTRLTLITLDLNLRPLPNLLPNSLPTLALRP